MKKNILLEILSFAFFVIGIILLLNSQLNITGAFLGFKSNMLFFSFFVGMLFLISSIIIFSTANLYPTSPSLEQRVALSSSIRQNPSLLRLTQDAVRDQAVEREMNHLVKELSKGNFEAGLGHPGHLEGTKIHYLRGRNGARLYYQKEGENKYKVVAKSAKGRNQEQVINKLKEIY